MFEPHKTRGFSNSFPLVFPVVVGHSNKNKYFYTYVVTRNNILRGEITLPRISFLHFVC